MNSIIAGVCCIVAFLYEISHNTAGNQQNDSCDDACLDAEISACKERIVAYS